MKLIPFCGQSLKNEGIMVNGGLDEFIYKIAGHKRNPTGIDNILSPKGDWLKLKDANVTIKRIINHLLIKKNSYPFDPPFGNYILEYLYEPADSATLVRLTDAIKEVIDQNKGNLDISHTIYFFNNKKGFRINIIINTNGKTETVSLNIDESFLRDI